jgi:hypothetical protein
VSWCIVKDWVEAQMAIVDTNMVQLEQVFLPYVIAPDGRTLYERIRNTQFVLPPADTKEGAVAQRRLSIEAEGRWEKIVNAFFPASARASDSTGGDGGQDLGRPSPPRIRRSAPGLRSGLLDDETLGHRRRPGVLHAVLCHALCPAY